MGNSPEMKKAMEQAFKEMLALSPEELRDRLKQTPKGPLYDLYALVNNQFDLDPEFSKAVDDNFWNLI